jgi:hypothetical protein
VRILVRDRAHGNRRRTLQVPVHTFIERFLLHVLPKGFKRIRHYGLLGPAGNASKLAQARVALGAPTLDPAVVESVQAVMQRIERDEYLRCPHCSTGHFVTTATIVPVPLRFAPQSAPP